MRAVAWDESIIDAEGERALVGGMDLGRFKKNPVLFFVHEQTRIPVGRCERLEKKDGKLYFDPVFDEADSFAMVLKAKYETGFMKGFSLGWKTLETTADPSMTLPGQRYETVVKCEIFEISCAPLPSNENALIDSLKAYKPKEMVKKNLNTNPVDKMDLIKKALRLPSTATELDASNAITELMGNLQTKTAELGQLSNDKTALSDSLKTLEDRLAMVEQSSLTEKAAILVGAAFDSGKISATEKEHYQKLALADYETVKSVLDAKKPYTPITAQLAGLENGFSEKMASRKDWTFSEWHKKDPKGLDLMKKNAPMDYKNLIESIKR